MYFALFRVCIQFFHRSFAHSVSFPLDRRLVPHSIAWHSMRLANTSILWLGSFNVCQFSPPHPKYTCVKRVIAISSRLWSAIRVCIHFGCQKKKIQNKMNFDGFYLQPKKKHKVNDIIVYMRTLYVRDRYYLIGKSLCFCFSSSFSTSWWFLLSSFSSARRIMLYMQRICIIISTTLWRIVAHTVYVDWHLKFGLSLSPHSIYGIYKILEPRSKSVWTIL